jgi:hypothetical protein
MHLQPLDHSSPTIHLLRMIHQGVGVLGGVGGALGLGFKDEARVGSNAVLEGGALIKPANRGAEVIEGIEGTEGNEGMFLGYKVLNIAPSCGGVEGGDRLLKLVELN